jgi:transcriptional regulator marR family
MKYNGGFLMSRIKQIHGRILNNLISNREITAFNAEQGRILHVLWENDNISIKELSARTGLAINTLTTMLERMQGKNLIEKKTDEKDKRKTIIILTDYAKSLKKEYNAISEEIISVFYKNFSHNEIMEFEEYLKRILDNLENYNKA